MQGLRPRTDKWDLTKPKGFCTAKETTSQVERVLIECERLLASYTHDRGILLRTFEELQKQKAKKTNDPLEKWVVGLNREFSKENIEMAKKYLKVFIILSN